MKMSSSSSNSPNRGPYHLRPRSKVVRITPPAIDQKISMTRREKSEANKKIAAQAKLPFHEIEGAGERFLSMRGEELKKYIQAKLDASGVICQRPKHLSAEEQAQVREKQNLRLAEIGLSYLNDPSNGDAEYELVNPVAPRFFICDRRGIYHTNFDAKLINDPEGEVQHFFVEIVEKGPGSKPRVTCCCSLGQSGSKAAATGLNGCRVCSKINHPKNVRFIKR